MVPLPKPGGIARRIFYAIQLLELREGRRVSYAEVGRRIGAALGRGALNAATPLRWTTGEQVPDTLDVISAIAELTGVAPGWLAFGDAGGASAPEGYVEPGREHARAVGDDSGAHKPRRQPGKATPVPRPHK